jgi:hypothetical protein
MVDNPVVEVALISSYIRNSEGSGAKSYMTNDLLKNDENICAFPHILGSPSSYMTLQPIPFKFPYTVYEERFISFLSVGNGLVCWLCDHPKHSFLVPYHTGYLTVYLKQFLADF